MAKYIDADKLCKGLEEMASFQDEGKQSTILGVVATIQATAAADVEEVKHGEWVHGENEMAHCSNCGNETPSHSVTRYCDYCGAKMVGGEVE